MKCYTHSDIDAEYYCQSCGKPCCKECIIIENDYHGCINCKEKKIEGNLNNSKSLGIAFLLSLFLPSAGQFYNNQYLKGTSVLAALIGACVTAFSGSGNVNLDNFSQGQYDYRLWVLGFLAFFFIWLYSMIDAYNEADKMRRNIDISHEEFSYFWGIVSVIVGIVMLLFNFQAIPLELLYKLWPAIFVVIGIRFIIKAYAYYKQGVIHE